MSWYGKKARPVQKMANGGYIRAGEMAEGLYDDAPAPSPSPAPAPAPKAADPEVPAASARESVGRMDGLETESSDDANERAREARRSSPTSAPRPKARPAQERKRSAPVKASAPAPAPAVAGSRESFRASERAAQPSGNKIPSQSERDAKHAREFDEQPLIRGIKAAANWLSKPHGSKITYQPAAGAKSIYTGMANGGQVGGPKNYGKK